MSTGIIAIVPARYASQRLSAKPMALLGGKPLIVRVCQNLQQTNIFDRIVVAVDHEAVFNAVKTAGFESVMTDADLPSGTDRVAAAAIQLGLPDGAKIINVQGDEPFVIAENLAKLAEKISSFPQAIATPIEQIDEKNYLLDTNIVKVALGVGERALYFSRSAIPHVRDPENADPFHWSFRHVGVYAYTHKTLKRITSYPVHSLEELEKLEQLRWLAHGETILCPIIDFSQRGIDTPEDLARANLYFQSLNPNS